MLTCERCEARLVVTSPARYACGTFRYGGPGAFPVDAIANLEVVENAILVPDHRLTAAERALEEENADLEALVKSRSERSATLAAVI